MNFSEAMKSAYSNYANFKGTASRSAFWWFQLFLVLVVLGLFVISLILPPLGSLLILVFAIGSMVPSLAITVRRYHDAGYSGKLYLGIVIASVVASLTLSSSAPVLGNLVSVAVGIVALSIETRPTKLGTEWHPTVAPATGTPINTTAQHCIECGKVRLAGQQYCQACGFKF